MRWQRTAEKEGDRRNVFVGSMMDIFEKDMPLINRQGENVDGLTTGSLRARFFRYLDQEAFPNLVFQLLTKRPQNIGRMLPFDLLPANVMIGSSISQETDIGPSLLPLLAAPFEGKRFVSIEPLVESIHLPNYVLERLDWVIIGGESGPKARPMHPYWPNDLIDQCLKAGVPVFFKQWGAWKRKSEVESLLNGRTTVSINLAGDTTSDYYIEGGNDVWVLMERVGVAEAGSEIKGKHYHQYPELVTEVV